jgi:hypothetical protein
VPNRALHSQKSSYYAVAKPSKLQPSKSSPCPF